MIDLERWKIISREIITKLEERSMLYLIYIVLGLLIVLAVNYAVTAFFAVHDWLENRDRDQLSLGMHSRNTSPRTTIFRLSFRICLIRNEKQIPWGNQNE
mgnify:CR=1 FL=1